jgi:hypothetical protein
MHGLRNRNMNYLLNEDWDMIINRNNLFEYLSRQLKWYKKLAQLSWSYNISADLEKKQERLKELDGMRASINGTQQ